MKRLTLLLLLISFISLTAYSQTIEAKGRVTDSAGAGLQGVSILVRGTTKGTQTDAQGNYSIRVSGSGKIDLVFSYTGFASQTVSTSGGTVNVQLQRQVAQIDDIVVVGYQTVRRKDLMASVSSVSAKDLKDIPLNSAAEALNGRLAGVTASTAEGSPDAEVRVRVRGGMSITQDNSPLYIVDGVQVENALNVISPQDIQSIDVLKDAAATAIYGARGANGVIVITTKTGRPGKLRVSYNGFVGVKSLANKLGVLDPYEYVVYNYERSRGNTNDSTNFVRNFGTTWDTLNVWKNVTPINWQEEVAGRTGVTQTHNIGFTGGNNKTTYNFSYTFNNDKAIVINSSYQRHLANFKGDYRINKKIKLGYGARYTHQDVYGAGISDEKGSAYNRLRNAVKYKPFLSGTQDEIDDNDPSADPNVGNSLSLINPVLLANSEYRRKSTRAYNLNANLSIDVVKNLTFRSTFGYDHNDRIDRQFSDSNTNYAIVQGGRKPIATLDTIKGRTITNSNVLTYSVNNFRGKHSFTALLGEETYQLETESFGRTIRDYPLNTSPQQAFKQTNLGNLMGLPRLFESKYTSLSFFTRLSYGYRNKYMAEFNLRADGSSKFSPEKRWGYFPSGSLAWVVSNEDFMKDVNFINNLKFRFGYGTVGNNRIDDYLYLTTFRNDQYYYSLNNQLVPVYNSTALVNEALQWESLVNTNFGLDLSAVKNRINFSFDYYINNSKDLLLNVPVASTYGYSSQLQNIGKTSNKGWELQLNTNIIRKTKNNFTWNANFNISHNENRIEALGKNQQFFYPAASWGVSGQPTDYIVRVGDPVGSMWGWVTDGFYKIDEFDYNTTTGQYTLKSGLPDIYKVAGGAIPGGIKFKDLSGPSGTPDGIIDDFDKTVMGNPTPDFTGGLYQQFTYKQWDASIFFNFSIGGDVYNANKIEFTNGYTANSNLLDIMQNRFRTIDANGKVLMTFQTIGGKQYAFGVSPTELAAANANATIWQPIRGSGAFYPHSWAIEDASFLRLNNITIGYTLPVKSLIKAGISRFRLYATVNNLAIITNYSGYDPEVSVRRSPLTQGLDYSAYPKSRTFIFGVNVTF